MFIVHLLHAGVFIVFGLPLVYLAVLSLAAVTVRLHAGSAASRQRRFVFVVPAYNESAAIARTVGSLLDVAYDRQSFDVVVVADNCTDDTAEQARCAGAHVLERSDAVLRGKGYALRWGFEKVLSMKPDYDAVVVIDADTTVSRNYLMALNVAIEDGADVLQTSDLVQPCPGAWTTEAIRLSFVLYNYVRPLGRKALGLSAGLRGNGMCFTRASLLAVPWHAYSKAEDLEYGLQMIIAGYRIRFVPEAIALATMPQQSANAESQRARWEGGRIGVIRQYTGQLLRAAVRQRSFASVDAFIDLVTPAFVNMMAISVLSTAVMAIGAAANSGVAREYLMWWTIAVVAGIVHVGAGLAAARDRSLVQTLFAIPKYVAWKLLLYLKLARSQRSDEWVRTTRESEQHRKEQQR